MLGIGAVRTSVPHTTRARDLDREVYQDPDSDRYLIQVKESLITQRMIWKQQRYRNVR